MIMDTNTQERENRSKGLYIRLTYTVYITIKRTFPTYPPQKRSRIREKARYLLNKMNIVI
jgi:hypothetical protein